MLIKTAVLPDAEAAQCWQQWRDAYNVEECSWPQHKLLVLISERLVRIAPESPEIRHIEGLAKANWTKSKLRLHHAGAAIDQLSAAGIDVLLLKGAVSEALSESHDRRRVTSDLDMMVRRKHLKATFDVLARLGLTCGKDANAAYKRCRSHPGVNIVSACQGIDVDIHHQPVHFPFLPDMVLDRIWRDARAANFFNRQVLIPSECDHLAFTVVQGMRRFVPSHLTSGLWAVDLARWAAQADPDWPGLLKSTASVRGSLALYAGLCYVRDELHAEIPESVFDRLLEERFSMEQFLSFFAQAPSIGVVGKMALPLREVVLLLTQQMFHRSARNNMAR
ncbi:MAG: nucleotidyltransferase family protein [Pseudomonadota bacterium]